MVSLTMLTMWRRKFSKFRVRPRLYWQWQNTLIIFALAPVRNCVFYAPNVKHTSPNQDKLINPLTAKLSNLNFHSLEVVDRVDAIHNFKWVKIWFDKMEINFFQILLIDVTFYI